MEGRRAGGERASAFVLLGSLVGMLSLVLLSLVLLSLVPLGSRPILSLPRTRELKESEKQAAKGGEDRFLAAATERWFVGTSTVV